MTISYPDTHTSHPAAVDTGEAYVPIYARKPPKKKATPWLLAAPVALVAVGAVTWIALSSDGETPVPPAETAEFSALGQTAPLSGAEFTETAPLDPTPPAAAAPAPVEATPAPARRAAAPAPRRAAAERAAPAAEPAPAAVEESATPTGPQPYVADTASPAPAAAESMEPEPILINPQPLD